MVRIRLRGLWRPPRLGVRGLMIVVGVAGLATWGVLYVVSPTRRLAAQLVPGVPAHVRRDAAMALGGDTIPSWERRAAVRELIGALDDANTQVRIAGLHGLNGRGADALPALPRLLRLAAEPAPYDVRCSASYVLGNLVPWAGPADRDTIHDALRLRLDDPTPLVRVVAAKGLLALDEGPALAALVREYRSADDQMAQTMAHSELRRLGSRSRLLVPTLLREARHSDPEVRLRLLDLIVQLTPVAVAQAEAKRLAADPDERVRAAATRLSTTLAEPAGLPPG